MLFKKSNVNGEMMPEKSSLSQSKIDSLVISSKIPIRLSCVTSVGWPCVLSLWFVCKDGKLFCASQNSSKIIQYLEKSKKVAFEIAPDKPPYRGIRGRGIVSLKRDIGKKILEELIERYIDADSSLSKLLKKNSKNEIAIEITPTKIFTYDYSKRMKDS